MKMIQSLQNPLIKLAVKLRDKRKRDEHQQFLIEGYRELLRASEASLFLKTLLVCPEFFLKDNEEALIAHFISKGTEVIQCSEDVFRKISYRDRPDGLFGITQKPNYTLKDKEPLWLSKDSLCLLIAQGIEKPGNLGTILRSSDAAGCDGVIVCDSCTDVYNPNVVRASIGTLFTVPVAETTSEELLPWLKLHGIQIVAATPNTDTLYTTIRYQPRVAIAVGAEQYGLTNQWLNESDIKVRLPMHGHADSLNVAMASTLMLYERIRQVSLN